MEEQFAEYVDLSTSFIADVENGCRGLAVDSISKICKSCNISSDFIVMGVEQYGTSDTEALYDIISSFLKATNKNKENH